MSIIRFLLITELKQVLGDESCFDFTENLQFKLNFKNNSAIFFTDMFPVISKNLGNLVDRISKLYLCSHCEEFNNNVDYF